MKRPGARCEACGDQVVFLLKRSEPDERGHRGVVPTNRSTVFPGDEVFRPGVHIPHADTCTKAERVPGAPRPPAPASSALGGPVQLDIFGLAPAATAAPGLADKAVGQAQVLASAGDEWKTRVAAMIDGLARRLPELTADDVREEAERTGLPDPHHPAAWGAALTAAGHRGVLRSTMRLKVSTRLAARGHKNPVHESLIYAGVRTAAAAAAAVEA